MIFPPKVGIKLTLIYVLSLISALAAVLVVAEHLIGQQVQKRHQKKLEVLSEKVFFHLEKEKDRIRLLAEAVANFGRMGDLTAAEDRRQIRHLIQPVFEASDLDGLWIGDTTGKELVRLESEAFGRLSREERLRLKRAFFGTYGLQVNRWEKGLFISSSVPIYQEEQPVGRVYGGVLIDHKYLSELSRGMDSFLAIVRAREVVSSTFSSKEEGGGELEFSEELLKEIPTFEEQPQAVNVEDQAYTMKALPLKNRAGQVIGHLVIGISREELEQTVVSLRRTIIGVGLGGALLGSLLMFSLTARMRRQVLLLAQGTEKLSSGGLDRPIPVVSRDELGDLALSFNEMAQALQERDRVLKEEKEKILANVDFLSMLVHDVKAPLAGVRLMLESLLEEDLAPDVKRRLASMGESTEELLGHLNNILAISKIEKGPFTLNLEMVDLNGSVKYVASQIRVLAELKEISILEDLEGDLAPIAADEYYLERIIYNLLTNALHWTPNGGRIILTTRNETGPKGKGVVLEVRDNGPGIAEELRPQLFSRYGCRIEKKDANGFHTGLGLYICRIIVEAHGGSLEERGRAGEGARFVCFLPIGKEERLRSETAAPPGENRSGESRNDFPGKAMPLRDAGETQA